MKTCVLPLIVVVWLLSSINLAYAQQSTKLRAVIAALKEVQMTQTVAFSISVEVYSLDGTKVPKQISLHTDRGEFVGSNAPNITIDLFAGSGRVIVSLYKIAPSKDPLSIYATSIEEPVELISDGIEIKVRQQSIIEIVEAPKTALADGKTTFELTAVVKDQWGEPMADVPCFVSSSISKKYKVVATQSDEQGRIFYTTPIVNVAGRNWFQFSSEIQVSPQVSIEYE